MPTKGYIPRRMMLGDQWLAYTPKYDGGTLYECIEIKDGEVCGAKVLDIGKTVKYSTPNFFVKWFRRIRGFILYKLLA